MAALTTITAESISKHSRELSESPDHYSKKPPLNNPTSLETPVHEISKSIVFLPEKMSQSENLESIKQDSTTTLSDSSQRIKAFLMQDTPVDKEGHERTVAFVKATTLAEFRLYYKETGQDLRRFHLLRFRSEYTNTLFLASCLDESLDRIRDEQDDASRKLSFDWALEEIYEMEQKALANEMDDDDSDSE